MANRVVYLVEDGKTEVKHVNIVPNEDAAALSRTIQGLFNKSTLPATILQFGTNEPFTVSSLYELANNQLATQPHRVRFEKKRVRYYYFISLRRLNCCLTFMM
jgi:hypothetical protein